MEAHLVVPLDMDSLFPEEIARVAAGIIAHVICSTCEGNQMGRRVDAHFVEQMERSAWLTVRVMNYVICCVVISIQVSREVHRRLINFSSMLGLWYDRAQRLAPAG